jgi:hypothetical protein
MAPRSLNIALMVFVAASIGCGKKKQQDMDLRVPAPVVTETKDTGDVFDEFYRDTNVPEKKPPPTFSMNEQASYVPSFAAGGAYVTQVGTLVSRWLADELATELKEKGFPAYVSEVRNPRSDLQGTFYRVRIGRFASIADAKAFGENVLKPAHYDFWVDRKSRDNTVIEGRPDQGANAPASPDLAKAAPPPPPMIKTTPKPQAPQAGETTTPSDSTPSGKWGTSGWQDNSSSW